MLARTTLDPTAWVDAAPFAAHLTHLSTATGIPWPLIAVWAGVPLRTASRLMGERGRRPRRMARILAQRLLTLTPEALARLHTAIVPAHGACARVADLIGLGYGVEALARDLACAPDVVVGLADGEVARVPALLALRAQVCRERADGALTARATRTPRAIAHRAVS